jgi:hypothetical protein
MDDIPWYSDASLEKPGHIFCVGLLTNCVRKWLTLSSADRALTTLKLSKPINNRLRLEAGEIEGLAKRLEGKRL